jgi:hypothetical protein
LAPRRAELGALQETRERAAALAAADSKKSRRDVVVMVLLVSWLGETEREMGERAPLGVRRMRLG